MNARSRLATMALLVFACQMGSAMNVQGKFESVSTSEIRAAVTACLLLHQGEEGIPHPDVLEGDIVLEFHDGEWTGIKMGGFSFGFAALEKDAAIVAVYDLGDGPGLFEMNYLRFTITPGADGRLSVTKIERTPNQSSQPTPPERRG